MSLLTDLEAAIDTAITNKNTAGSIGPNLLGTQLKDIAAFANPEGYSVFRAIINQVGINAPTLIILENTTGLTFTPTRADEGAYLLNATGGTMVPDKCIFFVGRGVLTTTDILNWSVVSTYLLIALTDNTGTAKDGINKVPLELLIYP